MFTEDELLPLSGLQHLAFCERRWALIHIEALWAENRFTAEGSLLHERAHSGSVESRPGVLVRRTLPLRSFRLGIFGQADVVEFCPCPRSPSSHDPPGVLIEGRTGLWRPCPIEYKRSHEKSGHIAYHMQLCAQAICLEEMLHGTVPEGAIYDGTARRRHVVVFDALLRQQVEALAARMHDLLASRRTPKAHYEKKCDACSLQPLCLPKIAGQRSAQHYLKREVDAALEIPSATQSGDRP
jgi:CRISPR-associated exonuclease Cas4